MGDDTILFVTKLWNSVVIRIFIVEEVTRQLNYCVRDGLLHLTKRVGIKGSKAGIETESYNLPPTDKVSVAIKTLTLHKVCTNPNTFLSCLHDQVDWGVHTWNFHRDYAGADTCSLLADCFLSLLLFQACTFLVTLFWVSIALLVFRFVYLCCDLTLSNLMLATSRHCIIR